MTYLRDLKMDRVNAKPMRVTATRDPNMRWSNFTMASGVFRCLPIKEPKNEMDILPKNLPPLPACVASSPALQVPRDRDLGIFLLKEAGQKSKREREIDRGRDAVGEWDLPEQGHGTALHDDGGGVDEHRAGDVGPDGWKGTTVAQHQQTTQQRNYL